MDINASTIRSIYVGLSTAFNQQFSDARTFWSTVAMLVPSSTAMNEYPRLDDMPGIREWIGERLINRLGGQTYIIRNREFEKTIGIPRKMIEDDQLGIYSNIASQFGRDAAQFPDLLVYPLLKQGNTKLCYDGQYFFDTDHPGWSEAGAEISVSNYQAGAGAAWFLIDDSQVVKPLVYQKRKDFKLVSMQDEKDANVFFRSEFLWGIDGRCNAGYGLWQLAYMSKAALDEANFTAARQAMMELRKRDGTIMGINPTKLLVPPSLGPTARRLLNAELVNGGESNIWKGTCEVVEIPYLA